MRVVLMEQWNGDAVLDLLFKSNVFEFDIDMDERKSGSGSCGNESLCSRFVESTGVDAPGDHFSSFLSCDATLTMDFHLCNRREIAPPVNGHLRPILHV